jgi:hypothetical protein
LSQALSDLAREYGWLGLALAIGAACRFWDLGGQALFIDEGFVFHISEHSPHDILQLVAYTDAHPPLFYLASHFLMMLLGWPAWDYRYLTATVALFGIAATWAIARRYFGVTAAAVAAWALAIEPALTQWDRIYRQYAVLVALGALSWWLLLRASDAPRKTQWLWWSAYGASVVLLPYTHYVGALIVASQGVYALTRLRAMWPALACELVGALALIPWLWALRIQYPHGGLITRVDAPGFSWPAEIASILAAGVPIGWLIHPSFDLVFSIVAVAVLVAGVYVGRGTILPYWLLPVPIQVIGSYLTGKDLVVGRYMLVYVPAFCIALGALTALLLRGRYRIAAVGLLAAYGALSAASIYNLLFVPFYQFPDWYQVNNFLLAKEKKFDLIVMDQGAEVWVVNGYSGFRGHQMASPALPSDLDSTIRWLRGYPRRRVWYVENQPDFTDPRRRVKHDLDATRGVLGSWRQLREFDEDSVRILLYGPRREDGGRGGDAGKKSVVKTASP